MRISLQQRFPKQRLAEAWRLGLFANSTLIAPWPPFAVVLVATAVIGAVIPPVLVHATSGLIDSLTAHVSNSGHESLLESLRHHLPWLLLLIGARLTSELIFMDSYQRYLATQLQDRTLPRLEGALFTKAMALRLELFESPRYYDTLRLARDAIRNESLSEILPYIQQLLVMIVSLVTILVILAGVHWAIPIALGVAGVYVIRRGMQIEQAFIDINVTQTPLKRRRDYWRRLLTERDSAAEVRLYGLQEHFAYSWRRLSERMLEDVRRAFRRVAIPFEVLPAIVLTTLYGSVLAVLVLKAVLGDMTVGTMVALIFVTETFLTRIEDIGWRLRDLQEFFSKYRLVRDFLELEGEERKTGLASPSLTGEGIRFEDVGFQYPGSRADALSHVDLHLRPGETLALVGENGAGKTTLTKLLLGLYQPTHGRITVDGVDLAELEPSAWKRAVSAIFQDYVKYSLTVRENIGFGRLEKLPETGALASAARRSSAAEIVDGLPGGYATLMGKEFEDGHDLSEGQWQKLALARLYLRDTDVLVLDEPASALDALAERDLYNQFLSLSESKTVVLVSHRLGSARLADRVVFLHRGRVVQEGTHDELMAAGGPYSELYRMQAEWYT